MNGRQQSLGTFPNMTAAERARTQARADLARGGFIDPRRSAITLDDWITEWMPHRRIRPSTREKEQELYDHALSPALGNLPLARITPFQIQKWLAGSTTPAGRLKKAHGLLKTALQAAIGDQRLALNPCRAVRPPTVPRKRWNLLTREQFTQLLAEIPEHYQPMVVVLAHTGLRWSEATALTRADYNPLRKTLSVNKSVDYKGRVAATKNGRERTVHLPPSVAQLLNAAVMAKSPDALIFTTPNGYRVRRTNFGKIWRPARNRADLPAVRIHDLRHSCASWLLESGATLVQVRDHLGHSSVTITELYLHTDEQTLADRVSQAFG